jgi:hypothetical protein
MIIHKAVILPMVSIHLPRFSDVVTIYFPK